MRDNHICSTKYQVYILINLQQQVYKTHNHVCMTVTNNQ